MHASHLCQMDRCRQPVAEVLFVHGTPPPETHEEENLNNRDAVLFVIRIVQRPDPLVQGRLSRSATWPKRYDDAFVTAGSGSKQ